MSAFARHIPLLSELLLSKPNMKTGTLALESRTAPPNTFLRAGVTFLSFAAVFMEHFFAFKILRDKPLYLVLHWMTSLTYLLIFHLFARNRPNFSYDEESKSSFIRRIPLLTFYIVTVYIKETDLATQVNTQGPSAFLVNLCLSPLIVTAALTCLIQDQPVSWVSALTVTYSGMMLMTVCSDDGSCYISFKDAAFNVAFTAFYGIYLIKLAQSLSELSVVHILFLTNTLSVALVPGLILFSREGDLIWKNPSMLLECLHPAIVIPLVLLRLFQMLTTLLHIKVTSVTTHVMTRNFAWIPTCIAIGVSCKIELMVSSFKAYWIVLASYMLYVVPDDAETSRPK